jgi:hypothetical protein
VNARSRGALGPAAGVALAVAVTLGAARPASAYCFTYDCDPASGRCPLGPDGCPSGEARLQWPVACVGFWSQENASRQVTLGTFDPIAKRAFAAWADVDCGGGKRPSIAVTFQGHVECAEQEYNQKGGNANILMFRDDVWPYTGADNTLALTTLTFNTDTGEIYDADMEVNGTSQMRLTTDDADVDKDLLSILTHEAGHFLGLGHTQSSNADATMFASYEQGSVSLRDLDADDQKGICALYPPDRASLPACDVTPRHGFSGQCDGKSDDDGCHAAAPGRAARAPWPLAACLAALAALGRRRARGRRRRSPGP